MNLGLFNKLLNNVKESNLIENFIKELSNYLEKESRKGSNNMENIEEQFNINDLREEDCLYQVVGISANGVYLQNMKNNKVFEETDIPKELLDKLGNDYILRYKNGEYIFEEQLTDDFFNDLIDIKEFI